MGTISAPLSLSTSASVIAPMPKSLGQIHTINRSLAIDQDYTDRPFIVESSQELTSQLGHMIRSGQTFKLVGIDMALKGFPNNEESGIGGQISGRIAFYSPTRGRVSAWKSAYWAVRNAMKLNGIKPNKMYDFRVPMMPTAEYENGNSVRNIASADGVSGQFCLTNPVSPLDKGVFPIHNQQLNPKVISQSQLEDSFTSGFGLYDVNSSAPSASSSFPSQ